MIKEKLLKWIEENCSTFCYVDMTGADCEITIIPYEDLKKKIEEDWDDGC